MLRNGYVMMNKRFLSVRSLASKPLESAGKQKMCRNCGQQATKEAIFDVGNDVSVIERYCETCLGVTLKEAGIVA